MIGGSVIGDIVGGQWVFDAITVELSTDNVTITDYSATVSSGASVDLGLDSVTVEDFPVEIRLLLVLELSTDEVTTEDFSISVAGGASIELSLDSVTTEDFPLEVEIIINGVPDFYLNRDGTTVDITVRNRDEKTVKVYRADNYNISYADLVDFTADTYSDTGLTVGNSYKYKLAFTDGSTVIGTRSTGKYTK